jgi:hypothetical protein
MPCGSSMSDSGETMALRVKTLRVGQPEPPAVASQGGQSAQPLSMVTACICSLEETMWCPQCAPRKAESSSFIRDLPNTHHPAVWKVASLRCECIETTGQGKAPRDTAAGCQAPW